MGMLIFSGLTFVVEKDANPDEFISLPAALYWAIITMTSVTLITSIIAITITISSVTFIHRLHHQHHFQITTSPSPALLQFPHHLLPRWAMVILHPRPGLVRSSSPPHFSSFVH